MMMVTNWMICLLLVWSDTFIDKSIAQTTFKQGETVTLSCSLSGPFTFPEWRGPPSLTKYTNQDDTSGAISPLAPAASRLQYATNNKDLILSNALTNDSGDYQCTYTGIGDHTLSLNVIAGILKVIFHCAGLGNNGFVDSTNGCTGAWCLIGISSTAVLLIIIGMILEFILKKWGLMDFKTKVILRIILVGVGIWICWAIRRACSAIWYVVIIIDGTLINEDGTWSLGVSVGALRVIKVTPRGPADGKLKVEDQIHKINGAAVTEMDQNKIEAIIKEKGIILTLCVFRDGSLNTSIVELNYKEGQPLGFDFENLAIVKDVTGGSKYDGKLKKGDRILSINGKSTAGKSNAEVNKQLKKPPEVLELSIRGNSKTVKLNYKREASSGIAIEKKEGSIVVSDIELESAAAISGEVQVGDCIQSVNGVSTAGLQVVDVKEMLTFSIILKVTKDVTLKELDPDHNGSFGVETFPTNSTRGPANMVDTVTHDGPAQRHGIKAGDTIVSINGKKTKGKSHQEIEAMLKTFGSSFSLKIKKGDTGGSVAIV